MFHVCIAIAFVTFDAIWSVDPLRHINPASSEKCPHRHSQSAYIVDPWFGGSTEISELLVWIPRRSGTFYPEN